MLSTELADGAAGQLCNAGAGEVKLNGQRWRRRHGWCLQTADADAGPTPLAMTQPRIDDITVLDRGHQLKYGWKAIYPNGAIGPYLFQQSCSEQAAVQVQFLGGGVLSMY